MSNYKKILVAVDLSEDSTQIAQRAQAIAASSGGELHLIHVIEPLSFAYGGDIPMDFSGIQDEIYQQASQQLERFAQSNNIDSENTTHRTVRLISICLFISNQEFSEWPDDFAGTGSSPPGCQGWHLHRRRAASRLPRAGPCRSIACAA